LLSVVLDSTYPHLVVSDISIIEPLILIYLVNYLADSCVCVENAAPEIVEKPGDISLSKLKNLYIQAKELSESEVT